MPDTEFPSLAEVLATHKQDDIAGRTVLCACDHEFNTANRHAEHQAAVWAESCTIRTREQLDALPDGVVIDDDHGEIWAKYSGANYGPWWHPASEIEDDSAAIALPARILRHPGWAK